MGNYSKVENTEKLSQINHLSRTQKILTLTLLNRRINRLIRRLFEMVYLTFFIATSYGVCVLFRHAQTAENFQA